MEDWKTFLEERVLISKTALFFIDSIPAAIVFSNVSHSFRSVLEKFKIWKSIFQSRWPNLEFVQYMDHKDQVLTQHRVDEDGVTFDEENLEFSRKVSKEINELRLRGMRIGYRYPVNWFRGRCLVFGFYGEKNEETTDVGPRLITDTRVITEKLFVLGSSHKSRGGKSTESPKQILIRMSKFDGDEITEFVHRRCYYFVLDGLLKKKRFLMKFTQFLLDFSGLKFIKIGVYHEEPKDSELLSHVSTLEGWDEFDTEPKFRKLGLEDGQFSYYLVLETIKNTKEFQCSVYQCMYRVSDEIIMFEGHLVKRKDADESQYKGNYINPSSLSSPLSEDFGARLQMESMLQEDEDDQSGELPFYLQSNPQGDVEEEPRKSKSKSSIVVKSTEKKKVRRGVKGKVGGTKKKKVRHGRTRSSNNGLKKGRLSKRPGVSSSTKTSVGGGLKISSSKVTATKSKTRSRVGSGKKKTRGVKRKRGVKTKRGRGRKKR